MREMPCYSVIKMHSVHAHLVFTLGTSKSTRQMITERLSLVLRLIDDEVAKDIGRAERQSMEMRLWTLVHAEFPQPTSETIQEFKERMKYMWIATANICGFHFWSRRFVSLQSSPPRKLSEDVLAVAMGLHPRLGSTSVISELNVDILSMIMKHLRADVEANRSAVFEAKYALWKYYVHVNMKCPSAVLFYCRLNCVDRAHYEQSCSIFMDGVFSDPVWRILMQD